MAESTSRTTKTDNKPSGEGSWSTRPVPHGWLYGLGGLLILLIVFAAGVGVAHHRTLARQDRIMVGSGLVRGFGGGERGMMMERGGINTGNQSRLSGVVTNVNGSNFTLAGAGTTNTITTSSSTTYQGGSQVKQNDTVMVFGTIANGAFNATQIVINP